MFEWLQEEISEIKTARFHLVDGPVEAKLQDLILDSDLALPSTYKDFVLKFGNAKLYRSSRTGYRIGVFAGPRERVQKDGSRTYEIGYHDGARVYVIPNADGAEFAIWERETGAEKKVANSFEEWLTMACTSTRNTFGKEKWAEILRGPEPFTSEEVRILKTRRMIHWRVLGIDAIGNHILEVTNDSDAMLPVLTIGVRSKDERLNGAILLKIDHISPGQTAVVHKGCYAGLVSPHELELFDLPDPQLEDREYFHELSGGD